MKQITSEKKAWRFLGETLEKGTHTFASGICYVIDSAIFDFESGYTLPDFLAEQVSAKTLKAMQTTMHETIQNLGEIRTPDDTPLRDKDGVWYDMLGHSGHDTHVRALWCYLMAESL